ncbi:hypothetical protein R6Q57_016863, partial [Mikania cordata]
MVLVNVSMKSDCQASVWNNSQIVNLGDTLFLFSKSHNKFIIEGCGTANISTGGNVLTGCSTICSQQSVSFKKTSCYGINCCQTNIRYYLENYSVNVMSNKLCHSAFLVVADNSYVYDMFSGQSIAGDGSSIPVVLRWTQLW